MLKKWMACIICAALVAVPLCGVAEGVNAFEFCELYVQRRIELDRTYKPESAYFMTSRFGDEINAACAAGSLVLDGDDLSIRTLTTTLIDFKKKSQNQITMDVICAISALEYDAFEDDMFELMGEDSATKKAGMVLDKIMAEIEKNKNDLFAGKIIQCYSGKEYNYSVLYDEQEWETNGEKYESERIFMQAELK